MPSRLSRRGTISPALAEAGTQAIQRLLQHTRQRAQVADTAPEQRADGQALPDPAATTSITWHRPFDRTGSR